MSANRPNEPPSEAELRGWRRNRASSRRRLPFGYAFALFFTVAAAWVFYFRHDAVPPWVYLIGLFCVWFQPIGDSINVWYLGRRLHAAERDDSR